MQSLCAEFITEPFRTQVQISQDLQDLPVHYSIAAQQFLFHLAPRNPIHSWEEQELHILRNAIPKPCNSKSLFTHPRPTLPLKLSVRAMYSSAFSRAERTFSRFSEEKTAEIFHPWCFTPAITARFKQESKFISGKFVILKKKSI